MPLVLPYTAEVLVDLLARYGAAIWPVQALALALATVPLALAYRSHAGGRVASLAVGALLAAAWAWVAWGYFWRTLAALDFLAPIYAGVFALQAALLLLAAALGRLAPGRPTGAVRWLAPAAFALAWAGLPLASLAAGYPPAATPVAGTMPGPTAALALAVLALVPRPPLWLVPLPLAWGFVAVYQGLVLGLPTAWATAGAIALAAAATVLRRWRS
jgi:hypothetical protein